MTTQPELENYLVRLERSLGSIAISEKAEIITEIKSHVLEAVERDSTQSIQNVLRSLGEPEQVASKYLLERGLRPQKPSKSPIVKWLIIGFLGTVGMCLLTFGVLIWKFTPLIQVNEEKGRVVLLGGLIDINEEKGSIKVGETYVEHNKSSRQVRGKTGLGKNIDQINIKFSNGKIKFSNSLNEEIRWDCRTDSDNYNDVNIDFEDKLVKIDFEKMAGIKCDIEIPKRINKLTANGLNGKIDFEQPNYDLLVKMANGKIGFQPDNNTNYKYEFKVLNGKIDDFTSSESPDSKLIIIELTNGKIEKIVRR